MGNLSLDQCVFTACVWEATARKAGNVHRYRDFKDLTYLDFIQSAHAIAPVIANMVDAPIGETVLECIKATRRVVNTNTNLGIVLLLVPLSKVKNCLDHLEIDNLLDRTTVRDSEHVYEAIRLAIPGGMGEVKEQDILQKPTLPLRQVMALAAERDVIAACYTSKGFFCFEPVIGGGACFYNSSTACPIEQQILLHQVMQLAFGGDSLIVRKCGQEAMDTVSRMADPLFRANWSATAEGKKGFRDLDAHLRSDGNRLNPGSTADLITASLFVALRAGRIDPLNPFTWAEYDA